MTLRQLKVAAFHRRTVLSPEVEANMETPFATLASGGAKRTLMTEHPCPANKNISDKIPHEYLKILRAHSG